MFMKMIPARHSIRRVAKKRIAGGGHMYIICLFFIMALAVVFKISFDRKRVYVTYEMVDDSIVTALVSSCVCNLTEFGVSDQLVIYRDLTPPQIPAVIDPILAAGGLLPVQPPYDPLNDPEIYSPNGDSYLDNCYEKFYDNLVHNLKLDAGMNATISGISGQVVIDEFAVFNVYRAFNEAGSETGYRIIKYTRENNGNWTVYDYGIDTPASVYSTFEHADIEIVNTSVTACISFDMVESNYSDWLMAGMSADDLKTSVTYQRVVDVTD